MANSSRVVLPKHACAGEDAFVKPHSCNLSGPLAPPHLPNQPWTHSCAATAAPARARWEPTAGNLLVCSGSVLACAAKLVLCAALCLRPLLSDGPASSAQPTRQVCFFAHSEADLRRPQPPGDVCAPLPPRADSGGVACTTQAEAGMGAHDELGAHWSSLFASSGLAALPSSQQDCGSSAIASIGSQGASPFTPPVTQALLLPTSSPLALLDQQVVLQAEQEKSSTHACTGMVAAASSGYVGAGAFVQAAPSSPGLAGCGYPFGEQGVDQLAHGSLRLQQHQRFWEQCMQPGAHFAAMMGAGGALGASQAGSGNFCTQMASAGSTRCAGGDAATPTALASRVQHPSADCSADVAALQLRILALGPSPLPISGEALALARDGGLHQCSHLPAQMFAAAAPAASSGPHATQLAHRHQPQRSAGGGGGGGAMLQCSAAASSPLMALHQEHPCQQ